MSDIYILLLRGINLGGKNKLPMKDLTALCEAAGATDVWTYIQSGNVVLRVPSELASALAERVSGGIASSCGFECPIVLLSAAELEAIVADNPWLADAEDTDALHVAFLAALPDEARVAALDPDRSPPDAFAVRARAIYMRCPKGLGRSKLTNAWFDSRLKTISTIRNWRTTLTLLERARAMQSSP